MFKSLRVFALFFLCASLLAVVPASAEQSGKGPSFSVAVEAPAVRAITDRDLPITKLDLSSMPILLDGVPLPEGPLAKQARQTLFLSVNEEQGVVNAFRTREEFDANLKARGAADCSLPTKAGETCVFWNGPNCTGTRAVAVSCGFAVPGITGPTWLNGPIQSLNLGCGTTFLIVNADCSGAGAGLTGVAGTCINVTNSPFNCAGCTQ